jgi:hypothetical protein
LDLTGCKTAVNFSVKATKSFRRVAVIDWSALLSVQVADASRS